MSIVGTVLDRIPKLKPSPDGYDPDDKTANGGQETRARGAIRDAVLTDPIADATRRARRALLILAVLVLVGNAGFKIEELPILGNLPSGESLELVLSVLSIGLVYFLVVFTVSVGLDLARWRYSQMNTTLHMLSGWYKDINDKCYALSQMVPGADQGNTV